MIRELIRLAFDTATIVASMYALRSEYVWLSAFLFVFAMRPWRVRR